MKMIPLNDIVDYQVTPIISITFYMVIIRVGLATRVDNTTIHRSSGRPGSVPLGIMPTDDNLSAERRRRMQVLITTITERKPDDSQRSLMSHTSDKNPPREIGFNGEGVAV
jgi:hypothetical protein